MFDVFSLLNFYYFCPIKKNCRNTYFDTTTKTLVESSPVAVSLYQKIIKSTQLPFNLPEQNSCNRQHIFQQSIYRRPYLQYEFTLCVFLFLALRYLHFPTPTPSLAEPHISNKYPNPPFPTPQPFLSPPPPINIFRSWHPSPPPSTSSQPTTTRQPSPRTSQCPRVTVSA